MDFFQVGRGRSRGGKQSLSGWRRAARVNTAVLVAMTVTMICCLVVSASRAGMNKAYIFFSGTCDGGSAAKLNVGLHLFLNVVSTAVFASSNFFMQVLNSPSRQEVDAAHARGSYLGIGVPSVRNAFRVSRFKTCSWAILLLSSIPIHLLFNSMIFQTDNRTGDYKVTMAGADFVNGAQYYAPGASLSPSGFYVYPNESMVPTYDTGNWGSHAWIGDYFDEDSSVLRNISATAADGAGWDKLDPLDCWNIYADCNGLSDHRDVIIVLKILGESSWVRDDYWHLKSNESDFWDSLVPADEPNSLWYHTRCQMESSYDTTNGLICTNYCSYELLGTYPNSQKPTDGIWAYFVFEGQYWDIANGSAEYQENYPEKWTSGFAHNRSTTLTVDYCLAEPVDRVCHVGLSNTLLLAVTICVVVKTTTAIVVTNTLGRRNQEPLVTVGDAIASFIRRPDNNTIGMCTVGQAEMRRSVRKSHNAISSGPRKWQGGAYRRWSAVPTAVWISSYILLVLGIGVAAFWYGVAYHSGGLTGSFLESDTNSFVGSVAWSFMTGVLTANSPQLLLSFCYLAFNNLFTRLQLAREWSEFSGGFRPLRVTDPKGEQYSTYRLQLPYKYSIPLILCSILLHWILSNTIYLYISEGGYYNSYTWGTPQDPSLPDGTVVAVGYSSWALLVLIVLSCVLVCLPVALSLLKLPGDIVNVGSNSIAISAACHVSPEANALKDEPSTVSPPQSSRASLVSQFEVAPPQYSPLRSVYLPNSTIHSGDRVEDLIGKDEWPAYPMSSSAAAFSGDDIEMKQLIKKDSMVSMRTEYSRGKMTKEDLFETISQSKIRWGVIRMPADFYREYDSPEPYEHLGFGVEGEEIPPPQRGNLYA